MWMGNYDKLVWQLMEGEKMLRLTFDKKNLTVFNSDTYFDLNYDEKWFSDPFVINMIEDVDDSIVRSPFCIESKVLGQIPPSDLSGCVKTLILMLKEDMVFWATACGDNCAKWILKIAEKKELTICLSHIMEFRCDFEALNIDTGILIRSEDDYRKECFKCL